MVNSGLWRRRDALVAEVAVDLEDPLEAADHQPLEVELRRDAQVEVHVQGVVVGDERAGPSRRPGSGCIIGVSTSMKPRAVEEVAHLPDDRGAGQEDLARLGVGGEVEVALAGAQLVVGQAVPLLRPRVRAPWRARQTSSARTVSSPVRVRKSTPSTPQKSPRSSVSSSANDRSPTTSALDVRLQATVAVGEVEERRLAVAAHRGDAAGDTHPGLRLFERRRVERRRSAPRSR